MATSSITATDGSRIVYDVAGEGPAIILLHGGGGGQTRRSWHQIGYVERLKKDFTVITMDIRGHGDSSKPTDPAFYAIDTMCNDVLAVADACHVDQFILWGFSYGGNIGRYLAAKSERVSKCIVIGIPFSLAASGDFRQFILDFQSHWQSIVKEYLLGSLEVASLPAQDQETWHQHEVPVTLAWFTAMLEWGHNAPRDLRCPTLWFAGSKNEATLASMEEFKEELQDSSVQIQVVDGLTHIQEFDEIELVFPTMLAFTKD
ncbi:MAG: alpha/beta hydrolase [Chloroflexota bacterium]